LIAGRGLGIEGHKPIGILEREGIQEHAVDNGKECRVGADAESECKDGDGSEAGALPENSQGKLDILAKISHGTPQGRREFYCLGLAPLGTEMRRGMFRG